MTKRHEERGRDDAQNKTEAAEREVRAAQALRANLRRRKGGERDRSERGEQSDGDGD